VIYTRLGKDAADYNVEWMAMGRAQKRRLLRGLKRTRLSKYPAREKAAMLKLRRRLLDEAGEEVIFPHREYIADVIMQRGEFFDETHELIEGVPHHCQQNSARLWYENREKYRIVDGYALSDDGLWRQHSWVVDANYNTIETTAPRVLYFGFILTELECIEFALANIGDEETKGALHDELDLAIREMLRAS
jgi:hypothetical protein